MARCAVVSFRLGTTDGVSAVAALWQQSLEQLGWTTVTVAGEGPVDRLIPELGIGAAVVTDTPVDHAALVARLDNALADVDLVLAENILSIPLNLAASRALAEVIRGRPAILHHHDPPWQRARFAHITELPPDDPAWRHVTINRLTEREFAQRQMAATTIYNGFDTAPARGNRAATRTWLDLADDDLLFVHPVRAIARKNVPAALRLAEQFAATYWLPGPAEEGYQPELDALLAATTCRVVRQPLTDKRSISDLYAASDLVLFPSTWEGFGNPPIEAAIHGRSVVVGQYPVADELRQLGFRWLDIDDTTAIEQALETRQGLPDNAVSADVRHNLDVIDRHLTLEATTQSIDRLLAVAGWRP